MGRLVVTGLLGLAALAGRSADAFSLGEVGAASAIHGTLAGTGAAPAHAALGTVRRNLPTIPVPDGLGAETVAPRISRGGGGSGRATAASGGTGKAWATGGGQGGSSSGKGWLTAASGSSGSGSGKAWLQGGAK